MRTRAAPPRTPPRRAAARRSAGMSGRIAAVVLLLAAAARAADHPIAADRLVLTDPPAGRSRRVRFVARRDAGLDPRHAGDPRASEATLTIEGSAPGNGSAGPIALDAAHWKSTGRGRGWRWL